MRRCICANGRGAVAGPREQLAIEDRPVGQERRGLLDLGEPPAQELLAARPQEGAACPAKELSPDAVPLPLRDPFRGIAQGRRILLERVGEVEGVRSAQVGVPGVGRDQPLEEAGVGLPGAHEPVGDGAFVHAAHLGERADHQARRRAHPKAAGDQLVPDVASRRVPAPATRRPARAAGPRRPGREAAADAARPSAPAGVRSTLRRRAAAG